MRSIVFVFVSIVMMGCASNPPRNKANACSLLSEKDEWQRPLDDAAKKWGIPKHTILSIIYHESKFISDAKPPKRSFFELGFLGRRISSAYGFSQALDGTWEEYKRATNNSWAERDDFRDSVDFIGWYLNRSVKRLGISPRNAYHLYLAYHQGDAGYRRRSYLKKPAIVRYARKVQRTALLYMDQMKTCS
jgi:hypothetical protein